MVWDTVRMDLDMEAMEAMEAMEDTGPITLARGLLILNQRLMPMRGMGAMDMDTEVMVGMVWDTVRMDLDMEDIGPITLARGLLILNPRLMPMRGMGAMDMDTEVMVGMVWDTVRMDLDMLVDMEAMDT